jgi:hypothetical protein
MRHVRVSGLAVVLAVLAVAVAGAALTATMASGGSARRGASLVYRIVFQGSGRATSVYPPVPSGTVFTSSISWEAVSGLLAIWSRPM